MERHYCACLCFARCKGLCRRTPLELLVAFCAVLPAVLDTASDWAVTAAFYTYDGDVWWFQASLGIQLLAGLAIGWLLDPAWLAPELWAESRGAQRAALSCSMLLLGLLGLGPAVTSIAPVHAEKERGDIARLKARLLCLEVLPQSILQSYVAVAFGRLEASSWSLHEGPERLADGGEPGAAASSGNWEPALLLAASLCISMVQAGASLVSYEVLARRPAVRQRSLYWLLRLMARAAQTTMLVFWVALLGCAFQFWAAFAAAAAVTVYLASGLGLPTLYPRIDLFAGATAQPGRDEKRLVSMPSMSRLVVGTLVCMLLMVAASAAVFLSVEHVENNYSNSSLPSGAVGDPQHFDCTDRAHGLNLAVAGTIAAAVLT